MISVIRYIQVKGKKLIIFDEKRRTLFEKELGEDFIVELKVNDVVVKDREIKDNFIFDKIKEGKLLHQSSCIFHISPEDILILKDLDEGVEYPLELPKKLVQKIRGLQISL